MSGRMIWHDKRLLGLAPAVAPNTHVVNGSAPLANSVIWIAQYAQSQGGLNRLDILCHGYEDIVENTDDLQSQQRGGFGLQICREGLTNQTHSSLSRWYGLIERIVIYSCAAADTASTNRYAYGDGELLMREIAAYTGAKVVAANVTQYYHYSPIDFGTWEGTLYEFDPNGGRRALSNSDWLLIPAR